MFVAYHITPTENIDSIMSVGIRPSVSGADGPGVYAWIGTLSDCLMHAELMMFDGTDFTEEQINDKMRKFTVLKCDIHFDLSLESLENGLITVWWDDYVVLRDAILPNEISVVGNFLELANEYAAKCKENYRVSKYYHVVADPLYMYPTLEDSLRAICSGIEPYIPQSAGSTEDRDIPRVCLAPSVEQCFTSIGFSLGPYQRKPVIIVEFDLSESQICLPTEEQVPDVAYTGEVWSLDRIVPVSVEVKWVDRNSIHWHKTLMNNGVPLMVCESIDFVDEDKPTVLKELRFD